MRIKHTFLQLMSTDCIADDASTEPMGLGGSDSFSVCLNVSMRKGGTKAGIPGKSSLASLDSFSASRDFVHTKQR